MIVLVDSTLAAAQPSFQRALLDQHCVACHNQRTKTAGLMLDDVDVTKVGDRAELWERVVRKLHMGMMPPAGRPRPDNALVEKFVSWLETELDRNAASHPNPGRTETFHRLNRTEYQNVVRDLLAVEIDVRSLLPADDASYGFDNIAGVLKLNESLLENYLSAALKISRAALGGPLPIPKSDEFRVPEALRQYDHIEGLPFGTRGGLLVKYTFPQDGDYLFRVDLLCRMAGCDGSAGFADRHELEVLLDGQRVKLFALDPHEKDDESVISGLKVRIPVKAGEHEVGAAFIKLPATEEIESHRQRLQKPYYMNGNFMQQRWAIYQPFVDKLTITGPFDAAGPGDTPSRRRVLVCRPAGPSDDTPCARRILSTLARRAYRRPVSDADIQRLLTFYAEGRTQGGFDTGIELALRRLLVSPEFLFRVHTEPTSLGPGTIYRISDLELASRISFFLWSSIPDDQLLEAASSGKLRDPATLEHHVRRMLADGRSRALVNNFTGQWLQLRNLEAQRPAASLFPDFDDSLREAFRTETELFVDSILREDRGAIDLLTGDYTFVNERLSRHYGIPNVRGSQFRRVALEDENRRGLLGQGSILTITSRPNRTAPVLRGKWILENILGTPPPPPPPNVPSLPEPVEGSLTKVLSMRERMAEHRANPACANCHATIDPLGFALEQFDAVGRWRRLDESFGPIDPSGALPNGTKFEGLADFKKELLRHPEQFVATLTEKLLTYALGRGVEYYDMPTVRRIVRQAAPGHYKLSSLIVGIATSEPFIMRKTGEAEIAALRH
jgi:hypothetical protein